MKKNRKEEQTKKEMEQKSLRSYITGLLIKSHTTHLNSNENENNKLATEPVYMVEGGDF